MVNAHPGTIRGKGIYMLQKVIGAAPEKIKRNPWLIMEFLITATAAFLAFRSVVALAAVDYATMRDEVYQFMEGFNKTCFTHMKEAYDLTVRSFTFVENKSYGPSGLSKFIKAIAGIIVITGAMWGVVQESRKGEISLDYVYRIIITTAVAVFVTSNVYAIMNAIQGAGDFMISTIAYYMEEENENGLGLSGDGPNVEKNQNSFIDALSKVPGLNGDENGQNSLRDLMDAGEEDANYWAVQVAYQTLDGMKIIVYAPMLVCTFLVFMAVIEIRLRQLFSPLAVAWIAFEGGRSSGARYLKKYASCFIKIAIYFVVAALGSEMTCQYFKMLTESNKGNIPQVMCLFFMLVSNVAAALSMMSFGGFGDEILGT